MTELKPLPCPAKNNRGSLNSEQTLRSPIAREGEGGETSAIRNYPSPSRLTVLPWCAKCGGERNTWIHHTELSEQERAKHHHEFEACVSLKDVRERDKRLADKLSEYGRRLGLKENEVEFEEDALLWEVFKELRGEA